MVSFTLLARCVRLIDVGVSIYLDGNILLRKPIQFSAMMNVIPKFCLAQFKDAGRTVNLLASVDDVKKFKPVSCFDFNSSLKYEVKWQKSDLEFDGYYSARILCLAATVAEISAKIKKNRWKEPVNMGAYLYNSHAAPGKVVAKKKSNKARNKQSKEDQTAIIKASVNRMDDIINIASKNIQSTAPKCDRVPVSIEKEENDLDNSLSARLDSTLPITSSESEVIEDENLMEKYNKLELELKAVQSEYEKLKAKHESCIATIKVADELRHKYQNEAKELKDKLQNLTSNDLRDECAALKQKLEQCEIDKVAFQDKIKSIALENVRIQIALKKLQSSPAVQNSGDKKTSRFTSDSSPNSNLSTVSLRSGSPSKDTMKPHNLFGDDDDDDFICSTPKKKSVDVKCDKVPSSPSRKHSQGAVKRPCIDEEEENIAKKVCRDLQDIEPLKVENGKVFLGHGISINADMWLKKLRCAKSDSNFINKFPVCLWNAADITQRNLTGTSKKAGETKIKATPEKVSVIMGAFKGRLRSMGVTSPSLEMRLGAAKTALSRKFTEVSRSADRPKKEKAKKKDEEKVKKEDEEMSEEEG